MATLPASALGRLPGELTLRVAYVGFDGAQALQAAGHLPESDDIDGEFPSPHCPNVTQGIDAACTWFNELN